jgi:hypothetical protein
MQEPTGTNNDQTHEALLRALSGHDVSAQLPVVARTRRAIRVANETRREDGERGRRTFGISLFAFGALFVLLAPVLWASVDDLVSGEHFTDLPTQAALVSTFLMMSIVAALVILLRSRSSQDGFRQDH